MSHEINLSGGDITVIKAIGISGGSISGEHLMGRCQSLAEAELIESLKDLIAVGYVVADNENFQSASDMKKAEFRVNTSYARDLKEAINPQPKQPQRRQRRS